MKREQNDTKSNNERINSMIFLRFSVFCVVVFSACFTADWPVCGALSKMNDGRTKQRPRPYNLLI